jgi:hypothetical protein
MQFRDIESKYLDFQKQYHEGLIDRKTFFQRVQDACTVRDAETIWRIDPETGKWQRFQNQEWVFEQATPDINSTKKGPERSNKKLPAWIPLGVLGIGCLCCFVVSVVLFSAFIFRADIEEWISGNPTLDWPEFVPTVDINQENTPVPLPEVLNNVEPTGEQFIAASKESLLISADTGLWLAREAGEPTQIWPQPVTGPARLSDALSPTGDYLALITADENIMAIPNLVIFDARDFDLIFSLPLIAEGKALEFGSPAHEASRAIQLKRSLTWSPDGNRLAFVAALDEPNADVYIYDIQRMEISRFTEETGQAFDLHWSLDNRYLVYFETKSFGTGAGLDMMGAWAVRLSDGTPLDLYRTDSAGEQFVDWMSPRRFIVNSWSAVDGKRYLRSVDLETQSIEDIFAGCFEDVFFDPDTRQVFLALNDLLVDYCQAEEKLNEPGLYRLPEGQGLPQRLLVESLSSITYQEQNRLLYLLGEDGWTAVVDTDGNEVQTPAALQGLVPVISSISGNLAWARMEFQGEPGVWIQQNGDMTIKIFDRSAANLQWTYDGQSIIFNSDDVVFKAVSPDFIPQEQFEFSDYLRELLWHNLN